MTKKLLLTAAAIGAMAFAGAASAADVTSTNISGVSFAKPATAKVPTFNIASEADLVAANMTSVAASTDVTVGMDSPVAISAGGSLPFAVTFTLSGPATFDGAFAFSDLVSGSTSPGSGVVVMAGDKKSVSFFVEFGGPLTVNELTLKNIALKVTGKQAVSIAAQATVTVAGHTQTVTSVGATPIVAFKSALETFTADPEEVLAELNDFKTFDTPATGSLTVSSQALGLTEVANVYKDLVGTDLDADPAVTRRTLLLADIISGATAKVTGPQVEDLGAKLGAAAATDVTSNSANFTLTTAELGTAVLTLTQATAPADRVVIEAGSYRAEIKPEFAAGFSGNADKTLTLITVGLEGTNFFAPWFALDNGTANSTLRLANNGSSVIGPVVVSLKASNGTAATGTYTIPSIDPGKFVSVRGDQLKAAFGTTAANGDLMITVQSQDNGLSAKVRTTQSTGQIYENSLGEGSGNLN